MEIIAETLHAMKSLQIRAFLTQAIGFGIIVMSSMMIYRGLMVITGSEAPVVVVLSGSMEPGVRRGDLLFLCMTEEPIRVGEVVVFNFDGREIPIVHRVIKVHEQQGNGEVAVLTKGDNNYRDDRPLYPRGQRFLRRKHIIGRAVGFVPYLGWATILLNENPIFKYIVLGTLGFRIVFLRD